MIFFFTVPLWVAIIVVIWQIAARAGQRKIAAQNAAALAASLKRCPDCAEMIQREAIACRFCGWRGSKEEPRQAIGHAKISFDDGVARFLDRHGKGQLFPVKGEPSLLRDLPPSKAFNWDRAS